MKRNIGLLFYVTMSITFFFGCATSVSIFKKPEIEAGVMTFYEKRLARWPVAYKRLYVPTRFGCTRIIVSGPEDGRPVILFHVLGLTGTIWINNVEALASRYRVYVVDTIGDLGGSRLIDLRKYPGKGVDYADWFDDMFRELGLDKASVVGASYGGWISLNCALYRPQRVERLALLGPMGVAPVTDGVVGKLIDLVLFPTDKKKQDMMHWTLGDNPAVLDEFSDQMMLSMNAEGKMAIPREFSAEELSAIKCPVYLFLGDKDGPIGPPAKAIERARAIPHLSYQVLTGTGHIMNFEQADEVNARLLEFLAGKKK